MSKKPTTTLPKITRHTVELQGYRHVYWQMGHPSISSPCFVALHGFGLSGEIFTPLHPYLYEAGYTLLAPDLLGFGASEAPDIVYSLSLYARLTALFVETLALQRVILIGHSMGGRIALATAVDFPEVLEGLVLINPGGFFLGERFLYLASHPLFMAMARHPLGRKLLRPIPLYEFVATPRRQVTVRRYRKSHHALDLIHSGYARRLHQITHPTLLLWGAEDHLLPRYVYHRILRALPHARGVLIPGAGHFPIRQQPEMVARHLIAFARELEEKS